MKLVALIKKKCNSFNADLHTLLYISVFFVVFKNE